MAAKTPGKRTTAKKNTAYTQKIANEIHAKLTDTVTTLVTSDAWPQMLAAMVKKDGTELSRFSFSNMLLILAQCPDATAVCTFDAWLARGRAVTKGSRSLRVSAPITVKDRENEGRTKIVGFRYQAEFDVSQTAPIWQDPHNMTITPAVGKAHPVKHLQGDAPAEMWQDVAEQIQDLGYSIERGNTGSANGYTDPKHMVVRVSDKVSEAQAAKTLAHELGHILADHVSDTADYQAHRGIAETVAESFAWMVSAFYGLDSAQYSAPYIATWAGKDPEKVMDAVQSVGRQVLAMFRGYVTFEASEAGSLVTV